MKIFFPPFTTLLFCALSSLGHAKIPDRISKLIPAEWQVLYFSEGDLNKDQHRDLAMIIEKNKPDRIVKDDEGKIIHNHPRQLWIFFNTPTGYQHIAKNNTLPVAEQTNSCLMDPLGEPEHGILIKNGILKVDFSYFSSCGSWEWPHHTYTFRWQNNEFQLIGFDLYSFYRNSGDETIKSYNFLTSKKKEILNSNMSGKTVPKTEWSIFKSPKVFHLENINFDDFYSQFEY